MAEDAADRADDGAAALGVRVHAEDFGLDGPQGRVFHGASVDAGPGSLIAVEGPSGSGRTCLLLALTGRMKSSAGHATVGRHRLPKQLAAVRRLSALGPVPGITDLDPALTVTEHLRERVLLQRRFTGSVRALFRPRKERAAASRARLESALDAAGLDLDTLPKGPRTRVRHLERVEALRLSVALALIGKPRLLALDDVDLKLSDAEREEVWETLRSIARSGTTVLAVCSEAPEDAVVIRTESNGRTESDGRDEVVRGEDGAQGGKARGAGKFGKLRRAGRAKPAGKAGEAGKTDESAQGAAEDETKGEAADALAEAGRA